MPDLTRLPTHQECEAAVERGDATALQAFIEANQPPRPHDEMWRQDLWAAVQEIQDAERRAVVLLPLKPDQLAHAAQMAASAGPHDGSTMIRGHNPAARSA